MKHRVSAYAVCPHYKHEDTQVIYCNGLCEGSVVHLAFGNKTDAKNYKREMCKNNYSSCKIYQMLEG